MSVKERLEDTLSWKKESNGRIMHIETRDAEALLSLIEAVENARGIVGIYIRETEELWTALKAVTD